MLLHVTPTLSVNDVLVFPLFIATTVQSPKVCPKTKLAKFVGLVVIGAAGPAVIALSTKYPPSVPAACVKLPLIVEPDCVRFNAEG
jgi:hypothetical protein